MAGGFFGAAIDFLCIRLIVIPPRKNKETMRQSTILGLLGVTKDRHQPRAGASVKHYYTGVRILVLGGSGTNCGSRQVLIMYTRNICKYEEGDQESMRRR